MFIIQTRLIAQIGLLVERVNKKHLQLASIDRT
ncbi:MAG: hypothetical protein ACJA13_001855, partial [Paraglaciecola sp.]